MKNIQIIDSAINATFSIFQASETEFQAIFPDDHNMEIVEDFFERVGNTVAGQILGPICQRPILKRDALGIHGTLYYGYADRRDVIPATKREVDWDESSINAAQRELARKSR